MGARSADECRTKLRSAVKYQAPFGDAVRLELCESCPFVSAGEDAVRFEVCGSCTFVRTGQAMRASFWLLERCGSAFLCC